MSISKTTQTFILRIWREKREIVDAPAVWRGVIENVFDGEKCSVQTKEDILAFIVKQMEKIGLKI